MTEESWDDIISEAGDGFNRPPEGEYDFIITDTESKVSKGGNPMIKVNAKITAGPQAGKAIKEFYVIRMASQAKKFMQNMQAAGISVDTLREAKPTMDQIAKVMVGKPFRGKVVHKSSEDWGDSAELSWSMKPPAGGAAAVTSFPVVTDAEALGYGSQQSVATDDDAGF